MLRIVGVIVLLLAVFLSGCATVPTPPPPTVTPLPTPTALPTVSVLPTPITPAPPPTPINQTRVTIRVVHAAANLANVDVYLGDQIIGFGLAYGRVSGDANVVTNEYNLRLLPANSRPDAIPLYETPITLAPNATVLAVIIPEGDGIVLRTYNENREPLRSQESRLSFIHAIPDGPPTTLSVSDTNTPLVTFASFGNQTQPITVASGGIELNIDGYLQNYAVALAPRRTITLVLAGTEAQLTVIPVDSPVPSKVMLRFMNASSDLQALDVYLDNTRIAEQVIYTGTPVTAETTSGEYTLKLLNSGDDPQRIAPLLSETIRLNPDGSFDLIILGPANALTLVRNNHEATNEIPAGQTSITFINAIATGRALLETMNTDTPLRLPYAQTQTVSYAPGLRDFVFVTEENQVLVEQVFGLDLQSDTGYLYLITGTTDTPYLIEAFESAPPLNRPPAPPELRLINTTNRTIQILVDGVQIGQPIAPEDVSSTYTAAAGEVEITITDANTLTPILTSTIPINAGNRYTLALYDAPDGTIRFSSFPTNEQPNENGVLLRLINLTETPLTLDYRGTAADEPTIESGILARPGQPTQSILITPGTVNLIVRLIGEADSLFELTDVILESGTIYDLIAVPAKSGFLSPW